MRKFNTTGPCLSEDHYMIPPEQRLSAVRPLIDDRKYFVIHAPRQTGKTTLLRNLSRALTEEGKYAALTVSLESFVEPDAGRMMPQILRNIEDSSQYQLPEELRPPGREPFISDPHTGLKSFLAAWCHKAPRPLVLFLDEVDSLPGDVLIPLLRQLRDGYTSRPAPFPASVVLVGMRDVRDYKIQASDKTTSLGTASPFNVKVRSLTLRNFTAQEVNDLLGQHTTETGQPFEREATEEIFRQTRGQPWLTNALAGQLVTDYDALIKDRNRPVTREYVFEAREILIERRDTHLDSLAARLGEDRVRRIIEPVIIGESHFNGAFDDDFVYTKNLGLVTDRSGKCEIANPIYQEIIPRSLSYRVQMGIPDEPAWYVSGEGTLDIMKLIEGFLVFWQENGEVLLRGMPYHEAAPHLVFMAWLQRIVNAGGRIEREFAIGAKRADLFVDFGGRKDVIELKLARSPRALERGIAQVAGYARRMGRDTGYLIIFDTGAETPWEERGEIEEHLQEGMRIMVLRA